MYLYLGGALTYYHRNNEMIKGTQWRQRLDHWAHDLRDVKTFNPAITFLKEKNHTYDSKIVVDQNNYYINKCNIMIVNLDDIDYSPGTIFELVRFKELGKPVIAFGSQGRHWSPHINSCISHQCETLDEVTELLCNMFI